MKTSRQHNLAECRMDRPRAIQTRIHTAKRLRGYAVLKLNVMNEDIGPPC